MVKYEFVNFVQNQDFVVKKISFMLRKKFNQYFTTRERMIINMARFLIN